MNKDNFGAYRKIDVSNMKTLEEFDKELFRVFTGNHWSDPKYPYIDIYDHKNGYYFLRMLKNGDVNIYEYTYEIPPAPDENNGYEIYTYDLFNENRRSKQLVDIYWEAEKFFNRVGYMINPAQGRNYKIDKYIKPPKKDVSYKEYMEYRYTLVDEKETLKNYAIRVGSLDIRRVENMLFEGKNDYLWVFPYRYSEEEHASKAYCYLLENKNRNIYDEICKRRWDSIDGIL